MPGVSSPPVQQQAVLQPPQQLDPQATAQPVGPQAPLSETPRGGNKGYNGPVKVQDQTIMVRNGVAEFNGQVYFVSDDGSVVINRDNEIEGRIVNGVFVEIDDQYLNELRAKGAVEE